jgi:hypothetical protein
VDIRELSWDEANEDHIARHNVLSTEVEEVVFAKESLAVARGDIASPAKLRPDATLPSLST